MFYDELPYSPPPPNTMFIVCQIVMSHKATLMGEGGGQVLIR